MLKRRSRPEGDADLRLSETTPLARPWGMQPSTPSASTPSTSAPTASFDDLRRPIAEAAESFARLLDKDADLSDTQKNALMSSYRNGALNLAMGSPSQRASRMRSNPPDFPENLVSEHHITSLALPHRRASPARARRTRSPEADTCTRGTTRLF